MEREIAECFNGKFVRLEKQTPSSTRSFKLYGTVEDVTNESILLRTNILGAIRLCDVVSITEWED